MIDLKENKTFKRSLKIMCFLDKYLFQYYVLLVLIFHSNKILISISILFLSFRGMLLIIILNYIWSKSI